MDRPIWEIRLICKLGWTKTIQRYLQYLKKLDLEDINTIAQLKEAFTAKYQLQPSQVFQLRQQAMNAEQGNQDVASYAMTHTRVCNKLNIDEEEQMHLFIKGLHSHIQRQLSAHNRCLWMRPFRPRQWRKVRLQLQRSRTPPPKWTLMHWWTE